jgi:hypothetical protein
MLLAGLRKLILATNIAGTHHLMELQTQSKVARLTGAAVRWLFVYQKYPAHAGGCLVRKSARLSSLRRLLHAVTKRYC